MATENNEWKLSVRVRIGTHWFLQLQTSYRSAQGGVVGRGCHRLSSTEPAVERAGFQGPAPGSLAISSSWTKLVVFPGMCPFLLLLVPTGATKHQNNSQEDPGYASLSLAWYCFLSHSHGSLGWSRCRCLVAKTPQYPDVSQVFGGTRGQWHANESREMPSCQTSSKDSFQWYYPIALTFEKLLF